MKSKLNQIKKRVDLFAGKEQDPLGSRIIKVITWEQNDEITSRQIKLSEDEYLALKEQSTAVGNIWVNWDPPSLPGGEK